MSDAVNDSKLLVNACNGRSGACAGGSMASVPVDGRLAVSSGIDALELQTVLTSEEAKAHKVCVHALACVCGLAGG